MKTSFELDAEFRETQGKGASRRLRRDGKVPAILYGGHADARALTVSHQKLLLMLDNERFYSTILSLKMGDRDAGGRPQGRATPPVQERGAAHRLSARQREREDPHQHSLAFQGRGGLPRRQDPGRNRFAHAHRSGGFLPAEGFAGIHRGRHFGPGAQREHPFVPAEGSRGRAAPGFVKEDAAVVAIHSPRAEEPEPTAEAAAEAAAAPAAGRRRRRRRRRRGCGEEGRAREGEAKKEPAKKDAKK